MLPYPFVPGASEAVDISSADHTFTSPSIVGIWVGTTGTVVAQLAGDSTSRDWGTVIGGTCLLGTFTKVVKLGTSAEKMIGLIPCGEGQTGS